MDGSVVGPLLHCDQVTATGVTDLAHPATTLAQYHDAMGEFQSPRPGR